MGKAQSVVAQNGSQVEDHMSQQNTLTLATIGLLVVVVVYSAWRHFSNRLKGWMRRQLSGQSGTGAAPPLPLTQVHVIQPTTPAPASAVTSPVVANIAPAPASAHSHAAYTS